MEIKKHNYKTKQNKSLLLFWKGAKGKEQNGNRCRANTHWSPPSKKGFLVSQPAFSNSSLWKDLLYLFTFIVTSEMALDRILHLELPHFTGLIWAYTRTLEHKPQVRSPKLPIPCLQASFQSRLFIVKIFTRRCLGGPDTSIFPEVPSYPLLDFISYYFGDTGLAQPISLALHPPRLQSLSDHRLPATVQKGTLWETKQNIFTFSFCFSLCFYMIQFLTKVKLVSL